MPPAPRANHSALILECIGIFLVTPALIAWVKPLGYVCAILWGLMAYCGYILNRDHGWSLRADWNRAAFTPAVRKRILLCFIPFALFLTIFTLYRVPQLFLSLPATRPELWVSIMLLYPPLSVLPQEIIGRCFFLRRYAPLMREKTLIIVSAAAFGWMHFIMQNWEAVAFSAVGGWLFADTYTRTRSLCAVFWEHTLYGCFIFTIGLGYFFYHGNAMH